MGGSILVSQLRCVHNPSSLAVCCSHATCEANICGVKTWAGGARHRSQIQNSLKTCVGAFKLFCRRGALRRLMHTAAMAAQGATSEELQGKFTCAVCLSVLVRRRLVLRPEAALCDA